MLPIDMKHDPATGEWSIVTGTQHVFKALRWPDCDVWWQSVRRQCPDEADQLRGEDVRREFSEMVERVQSGCYCRDCREALTARHAPEACPAPVSPYIQERVEPVRTLTYRPKAQRAQALPPLTYAQARRRYMDTGTIADKEAMLAAVTMTAPDLDTIGRDWEPPARKPERASAVPKRRIRPKAYMASMAAIGLVMYIVASVTAIPKMVGVIGVVCFLGAMALSFTARSS